MGYKCRTKLDVEFYIRTIRDYEESHNKIADCDVKELVDDMKRAVRKYLNKPADSRQIIHCGDTGEYVEIVELVGAFDEESAEEVFNCDYFIPVYYSQYDCTGRPFTSWHKVFERRGSWYAYHSVGIDC